MSSARGWFSETINTIGGKAQARPMTPTRIANDYIAATAPTSPRGRPYERSSPLRGGGRDRSVESISRVPSIERVPSKDACERSLHNSSHGKTTVQELKRSNAKLTDKISAMEADFMNQMNEMRREMEEENLDLQESLGQRNKQLASMADRVESAEARIRERDAQVHKLKEETSFQRHTIADLRNQLYQLQHEMEEDAYKKKEQDDKWHQERTELTREMDGLKELVAQLELQVAEHGPGGAMDGQSAVTDGADGASSIASSSLPAGDASSVVTEEKKSGEILQSWKQLEETQRELSETREQFHQCQSALATLEIETERLTREHTTETTQLRGTLADTIATLDTTKKQLRETLETAQKYEETRDELETKSAMVEALETRVSESTDTISKLTANIEKLQKEADSRERYRHEEAEDLRVLNDAQEEELHQLQEICDEMEREINEKDEALEEREDEIDDLTKKLREVETSLAEANARMDLADSAVVAALESKLKEYQRKCEKLEETKKELEDGKKELEDNKKEMVTSNESETTNLRRLLQNSKENNLKLSNQLNDKERELQQLQEEVQRREEEQNKARGGGGVVPREEADARAMQRVRQVESKAAQDRADMEIDFKQRIAALMESKKQEILGLEQSLKKREGEMSDVRARAKLETEKAQTEVETLRKSMAEQVEHIEKLQRALNKTEAEVKETRAAAAAAVAAASPPPPPPKVPPVPAKPAIDPEELEKLRAANKVLETENAKLNKLKDELREAQVALVALDDDRKKTMVRLEEQLKATEAKFMAFQKVHERELSEKNDELKKLEYKDADEFASRLEEMKVELMEKEATIQVLNRKIGKGTFIYGNDGAMEVALRKELKAAREIKNNLSADLNESMSEAVHLREKLDDRDTTISALVKASVAQEAKVASLKAEIGRLKLAIASHGGGGVDGFNSIAQNKEAELRSEIEMLKSALNDYKDVETRLHKEIDALEKKLFESERESHRLREQLSSADHAGGGLASTPASRGALMQLQKEKEALMADHQEKLQERDNAIAQLVKQSMAQDELSKKHADQIALLNKELEDSKMQRNGTNGGGPSWEDLDRLQKESEIFASQIIEQDEEMEAIRGDLEDRTAEVEKLRQELAEQKPTKSNRMEQEKITDLQAELDELQEANESKRQELRELRKELREAKAKVANTSDVKIELDQALYEMDQLKAQIEEQKAAETKLQKEISELEDKLEHSENKLNLQQDSMRLMREQAVEELESKLKDREEMIERLEKEANRDNVADLQRTVNRLTTELETKSLDLEEYQEQVKDLQAKFQQHEEERLKPKQDEEKLRLQDEIDRLNGELELVEEDRKAFEKMKRQLAEAEDVRIEGENTIVDAYERKMSLLKLNKDVTIDQLRKELVDSKSKSQEVEEQLVHDIQNLKMENKDLHDELDAKLELKDTKIHALEQTLGAQEQLVENMRQEMDHLQHSMERSTIGRRAEIEEMQQEVIDASARAQTQEREITALRMQLEETQIRYRTDVAKLEEAMAAVEAPIMRSNPEDAARLAEIKGRFEDMKWRNRQLVDQNNELREQLGEANNATSQIKNENYRASALEEEVSNLQRQVRELEDEKTTWNRQTRAAMARPPTSKRSSSLTRSGRSISSGRRFPVTSTGSSVPSSPGQTESDDQKNSQPNKSPTKSRGKERNVPPSSPLTQRFFKKKSSGDSKKKSQSEKSGLKLPF